jgi:hypothetical protein
MPANMDGQDPPGYFGVSTIDNQGAPIGLEECHTAVWPKDACHLGYRCIGVSDVLERALAATCVEARVVEWEEGCVCCLEADISAMTMAPSSLVDHGRRKVDAYGPTLGLGPVGHDEDVLTSSASDIESAYPGLKAQDVEAPVLGTYDGRSHTSGIEIIDELTASARGVDVTEGRAGTWQIRHNDLVFQSFMQRVQPAAERRVRERGQAGREAAKPSKYGSVR